MLAYRVLEVSPAAAMFGSYGKLRGRDVFRTGKKSLRLLLTHVRTMQALATVALRQLQCSTLSTQD